MATDNTYPSTKVFISEKNPETGGQLVNYTIGLSNYRRPLYCFINPTSGCYTELRAIGSEPVKYKASFKIRIKDDEYEQYNNQIVIWNSPYLNADKVKEAIINLGIERDGFTMTAVS